jgi:hypothetical protein
MWMARATISLPVPVSPRSRTVDARQDVTQRRRLADDGAEVERAVRVRRQHAHVLRELLLQAAVVAQQREALDRVRHDAAELLRVPGLRDVAVDAAQVDGLDQHVDVGEGRDDDAGCVGAQLADRLEQLEPRHLGHPLIRDDDGDVVLLGQRERLFSAVRQQELEALAEVEADRVQVVLLVVDDEHGILRELEALSHAGTVTRNAARSPRVSSGIPAVFAESAQR